MKPNRLTTIALAFAAVVTVAGCGPSREEIAAQEQARFELEEKARQEAVRGNKAITEMTNRTFRRRTPEEEAKHQAGVKQRAQEIIDAQKRADAEAANAKSKP